MVSIKLSLTIASMAFLQLASARKCTGSVKRWSEGGFGGPGFTHSSLSVWINDDPDNILDEQNTRDDDELDIYDGVQTLTSDDLPNGDLRLWAERKEEGEGSSFGMIG